MVNRRRPVLAVALVLASVAPFALGAGRVKQAAVPLAVSLFQGELGASSNLVLGAWGSGNAEASRENTIIGNNSIKVTTQGMYQGARLDFKQPVDVAPALSNKQAYLRFRVLFTGTGSSQSAFDPGTQQTSNVAASPFKKMRFLLVMADGTRYEIVRPVELPPADDQNGYFPFAFPFAALTKKMGDKLPTGDGAKLKSIAIFGDRSQQFFIGEINIITDETEINVAPLEEQIFFAQQPALFIGNAEAGASTLKYSWDFNAADGIQEDAVGRSVYYTFPKSYTPNESGNARKYTVTLTVSDIDGLKKPASTTLEAEVGD